MSHELSVTRRSQIHGSDAYRNAWRASRTQKVTSKRFIRAAAADEDDTTCLKVPRNRCIDSNDETFQCVCVILQLTGGKKKIKISSK